MQKLVKEFHDKCGIITPTEPTNPAKSVYNRRNRLIYEELRELNQAITEENFTETLDALCDLVYVVLGSYLEFGVNKEFSVFSKRKLTPKPLEFHAAKTLNNLFILVKSLLFSDYDSYIRNLDLILIDVEKLIYDLGFTSMFEEAFEIVHATNMEKVKDGLIMNDFGKIQKPKGWISPKVKLSKLIYEV